MKIVYTFLLSILCSSSIFAQTADVAAALLSGNRINMEGQQYFNIQTIVPINLSEVVGGGNVKFPPSYISYDYGIESNWTIGAFLGYSASRSKSLATVAGYDVLSIVEQVLCDTDPQNALSLGLNCSKVGGNAAVVNKNALIGANVKYFIEGNDQADVYGSLSVGGKLGGTDKVGIYNTASSELNTIIKAYDNSNKVFVLTSVGTNYYLNQPRTFALKLEVGYAYGLGDNIAIGQKALFLSLGTAIKVSR
jgi:hypothetical protein